MPASIPRNYHLTSQGESFIDEYHDHWTGAGDPTHVLTFLWWMRETGDFQNQVKELVERVGEQRAFQGINWAVEKGYLEKDLETGTPDPTFGQTTDPTVSAPHWSRGTYPPHQELMNELRKAKLRGDEAEYSRLADELAKMNRAPGWTTRGN